MQDAMPFGQFYTETKTVLAANATYTGAARDTGASSGFFGPFGYFSGRFLADQIGTAFLEESSDGTTWFIAATAAVAISTPLTLQVPVTMKYNRVRLLNGGALQTVLNINSAYTGS